MSPTTQRQWTVQGKGSFDNLKFNKSAKVEEVGDYDVLVKFQAASLNYRDLIIAKGTYPFPQRDGVVPGSDGAGVVEAVGKKVSRFQEGDKVATLFNQGHLGGYVDTTSVGTGVGGIVDGALQEYGLFNEQGLVKLPNSLSALEGATLPCAALTAWNALYGISDRALRPGHWVLTQGTGGVSIFAVQFAKAAGARVIATTSSAAKAAKLKELGADYIINYKDDKSWGETAKKITGGKGVQHVVEVGGPSTTTQSLKAIAYEGVISIIGFIGGFKTDEKPPTLVDALTNICTIRGVYVGSRLMMQEMIACIEANSIKPVIDDKVFTLDQLKEAYQYQWEQKHFGKLCIKID